MADQAGAWLQEVEILMNEGRPSRWVYVRLSRFMFEVASEAERKSLEA